MFIELALEEPESLAARDRRTLHRPGKLFCRLLKAHDLITSPAFLVVKAAALPGSSAPR
jgi:hypothetical protein